MEFDAGEESRCEEGKALDVVPVGMADQQVHAAGPVFQARQVQSKVPDSGSRVKDDMRSVARPHFYAGSISTVDHRSRPGSGYRPAGAPKPYVHFITSSAASPLRGCLGYPCMHAGQLRSIVTD